VDSPSALVAALHAVAAHPLVIAPDMLEGRREGEAEPELADLVAGCRIDPLTPPREDSPVPFIASVQGGAGERRSLPAYAG
jgi:hypothetical protein